MDFLEKDLEQIIWEASEDQLEKAGLYMPGRRFRQLRIGNYGIADLVTVKKQSSAQYSGGIDNYLLITVYELKKHKIGISAFLQAISYVAGIKSYLEKRKYENAVFRVVLIGREMDMSGSFCFLNDLIGFTIPDYEKCTNGTIQSLDLYTYEMKIDGLFFREKGGIMLSNEGF